ncbi:FAD-dependent oxidoreductase [Vibrio sp. 404]|uniref:FAD-dependent oxidoreductase n=1 Tax=Vibrio marinisediminis TaxID=2758441 RepID=A0A7W2FQX0_9VIBR|nr:FAD-dependent oxidoreductase [Vibrio marinisediminis]MBA5762571.1 FAD-dependent oxidoreductase [Vibrio marinisediminis]
MKIAIIGTGISGLTCGYYLHKQHDITLFEANDYIGGHTATVDIEIEAKTYPVDTGFIVYNDRTYPHFIKMMNEIGVEGVATQMSFSVSNKTNGLEYNGHTIATLFAQKRNWLKPRFYRFIAEILRFNKLVKQRAQVESRSSVITDESLANETLGDFLNRHGFSYYFNDNYILPMGAAIWSSTLADMRAFPLDFFAQFFLNHGLLDVINRPQWYVIKGGSNQYIPPLTRGFADKIKLNCPVNSVRRDSRGVYIEANGQTHHFDHVIFACHSDQALAMLSNPSTEEEQILSALTYQSNEVILHSDSRLLPQRKSAWAAWNYRLEGSDSEQNAPPTLTYNMNILQQIDCPTTLCVSLNSSAYIDQSKILRSFNYSHPVFTTESIAAQKERQRINGINNCWFCGAYWYNGFHEDGVRSAIDIVEALAELDTALITRGAA